MAHEIKMPQLSDTMDAGKILSWKKKEGDAVQRGEILAEVETDKANLEIECFHPGVLLKIVSPVGTKAKVGEVIAVIGEAGEAVGAPINPAPSADTLAVKPEADRPATPAPSAAKPAPEPVANFQAEESSQNPARIKASPLARKLAEEKQVNLTTLRGSGPSGRIVRKDVEAAVSSGTTPAPSTPTPSERQTSTAPLLQTASDGEQSRYTALSRMREAIARRMQESMQQSPHFYLTVDVDMEQAVQLRDALKEDPEYKGLSLNHLVIKAAAYALRKVPGVNCAMRDGQVYHPAQINIGIITSVEDGLLIPVIREADKLSLHDLAFEARAAVERVRAGRPSSTDLSSGTFSISNMGMFEVENFTAIINPGQGAVLAVSSARETPVIKHGVVVPGLKMKATLSVDHRIIDGVMAATFMKHFRTALEIPALIMH